MIQLDLKNSEGFSIQILVGIVYDWVENGNSDEILINK